MTKRNRKAVSPPPTVLTPLAGFSDYHRCDACGCRASLHCLGSGACPAGDSFGYARPFPSLASAGMDTGQWDADIAAYWAQRGTTFVPRR